ncbi:ATP-binding protein [Pyramidobacter sp. YE332]|uniref:sensor histidine kinase n=1 Tax=Pyramidobacter sp. YE332 TaxID=3068894 RepID=UPI00294B3E06|nr:ATP-binding protein [Pyramidobacter sp. YE332]WOL39466.1 ATP-binding protein [Pyramidobacter sp. YE332]
MIVYRMLFARTFDPIALYRVEEGSRRSITADRVFFVDVNPSYERVMKVRRRDVIGRSFLDVWPISEPRWSQIIVDCLRLGHSVHCEGNSKEAGSFLEAIAFPLPPAMAAVIFLDKTKLKDADEALDRKKNELRNLATQLTLTEESTRRAIATDLHDRIGYDLVSQLHKIRELREKVRPALEAEMAALEANTEKMICESRSLIFELSPPILKEVGINPALESLADNLLTPHGIKWELRAKGTMADFWADDAVCVILYRMARELLINVIKHSGATRVTIIVNRGPGKIMVAVEDNGRGFPEDFDLDHNEARKETKSFGLFSIRERLEPIDGTLKIVSIPGKGATVAMSCPLKLKEGEFK